MAVPNQILLIVSVLEGKGLALTEFDFFAVDRSFFSEYLGV
jgi:hypothetical protein